MVMGKEKIRKVMGESGVAGDEYELE